MNSMKLSKYNNLIKVEDGLIIYNTLTSGVIKLNQYYSNTFFRFKEYGDSIPEDLEKNLSSGGMIVDENFDEDAYFKTIHHINRFQNRNLSLTIAPTLECNFGCFYCYEAGRRYNTMSKDVICKTLDFIDYNMKNVDTLGVVWYGGEPLLAIDIIEEISNHIINNNYSFSAGMVTNGYLLDRDMALKLKSLNINTIQVTLDGPKRIHDSRRNLINGEGGTFDVIAKNISEVYDILTISIRVNLDSTNIDSLEELFEELDAYNLKGKVSVYLAPVTNLEGNCMPSTCFTDEEFAQKELNLYRNNIDKKYLSINIPKCNPAICGAISPTSFIIDPLGDFYKCWDDIGNSNEITGSLSNNKINANLVKWLSYDYQNNIKCKDCSILPICVGGCPNYVMKGHEPNCHTFKYNNEGFIDLFRKRKEENK